MIIYPNTICASRLPAAARISAISSRSMAAASSVRPSTSSCTASSRSGSTTRFTSTTRRKRSWIRWINSSTNSCARRCARSGVTRGVEISFLADIPAEGSGLGSSSSVTVGRAQRALSLRRRRRRQPSSWRAKRAKSRSTSSASPSACRTSTSRPMAACAVFEFGPGQEIRVSSVKMSRTVLEDMDNMLMLFFTGKTRQAVDDSVGAEIQYRAESRMCCRKWPGKARPGPGRSSRPATSRRLGRLLHAGLGGQAEAGPEHQQQRNGRDLRAGGEGRGAGRQDLRRGRRRVLPVVRAQRQTAVRAPGADRICGRCRSDWSAAAAV